MFTSDTAKYKIIGICTSCVQSDYVRDKPKGCKRGLQGASF